MKLALKIIITVLAAAAFLFGGFVAVAITALGGGLVFHQVTVAAVFIIVFIFALMQVWQWLRPKTRIVFLAAAAGIILISVTGFGLYGAYDDSFERVDEQGVDLSLYDPFREGTLAVSLDEPSTLLLTDNLPRLDGATALYPVYAAFAKAVYPAGTGKSDVPDGTGGTDPITVEKNAADDRAPPAMPYKPGAGDTVACTNTNGAYSRLVTGDADIIFAAGPSEGQLLEAREAGVELTLTPIGREAFVFFVNAGNPVDGLSISDIQRIYSGGASNWREFGGKNAKIRAFQRPENSGSQTALIKFMGGVPLMAPPTEDVAGGMGGIINRVSSYRNYNNAIGYSFLFFATEMMNENKIKLLKLEGVAPTRENVENKSYPYASEFYAVTAGTDNPNAGLFIEWILSGQGRFLIAKTGYTPL